MEQLYRWKEIKGENDLPKNDGLYTVKKSYYHFGDFVTNELCQFKNRLWNKGDSKNITHWLEPIEIEQDVLWKEIKVIGNKHDIGGWVGRFFAELKSKYHLIKK